MRFLPVCVAVGVMAGCAAAATVSKPVTLQFDPQRTKVQFTLGAMLHTVHGAFQLSRGAVEFDPETGKASGEVVVDAKSGDSGSGARDVRMKKNVLDADHYPDIVFAPDHVEGTVAAQGASDVNVHGMFRIHGREHEMTIPVHVVETGGRLMAKMHFDVPYVRWGMKNPSTLFLRVDKTVRIDIDAVAKVAP